MQYFSQSCDSIFRPKRESKRRRKPRRKEGEEDPYDFEDEEDIEKGEGQLYATLSR